MVPRTIAPLVAATTFVAFAAVALTSAPAHAATGRLIVTQPGTPKPSPVLGIWENPPASCLPSPTSRQGRWQNNTNVPILFYANSNCSDPASTYLNPAQSRILTGIGSFRVPAQRDL
jgi:hypothetical protein